MQSDQPAILNPAFSVFCLVDLEVDIETGVVSLGSSFALATAPGLVPQDSGMVEAGMMEGLFAALLEEPDAKRARSTRRIISGEVSYSHRRRGLDLSGPQTGAAVLVPRCPA